MALSDKELCTINPAKGGVFVVTTWNDRGTKEASFDCATEQDARALRDAIRQHATKLREVFSRR